MKSDPNHRVSLSDLSEHLSQTAGLNLPYPAFAPQPNLSLQLTPTASLLVPCASLRRR
jgi:hypothetical protein